MENKSLGKGLEDISDIFLSKAEEKQPKGILEGFSSAKMRDETCDSCVNFIVSDRGAQTCKIFSRDHEKLGVPYINLIIPIYANFCKCFNPVTLSPIDRNFEERNKYTDNPETECEVEETIRIGRKIAYPNSDVGQKNIRKTIFEYFEEGYKIQNIELRKNYMVAQGREKKEMDVEVTMFVKQI